MPAVRSCRVCGCADERACPGGCSWVDESLCSACVVSLAHVVMMTRDGGEPGSVGPRRVVSVATCRCGFLSIYPATRSGYRKQDAAIRNHWREAVALAGGVHA